MRNAWNIDPLSELGRLQRDLNHFFGGTGWDDWKFPFSRMAFLPGRSARAYPLLNIEETDDSYIIEALAPGADPEKLNLSIVRDQLTISGAKPGLDSVKAEAWHRNERAAGSFVRTVTLPGEVDAEKVEAHYKNGLLTVTLRKAEGAKPKQITIKTA
jgi:HSP20 family protein